MITASIIVGIILIFLVFLTFCIGCRKIGKFDVDIILGIIISILFFIEVIIVGNIISEHTPTAMDVYQSKTTLEYKVVDGVKVDSLVIFKNDDYGKQN